MENLQSPITSESKLQPPPPPPKPKSGRKPLHPRNNSTPTTPTLIPQKPTIHSPLISDSNNKENQPPPTHAPPPPRGKTPPKVMVMEALDASLAEELSTMRKREERLRMEREKTERLLNERAKFLDFNFVEIQNRGEVQKMLEIEVDRLFRFKELHSYYTSMMASPIQSLREKESERKTTQSDSTQQQVEAEEMEESVCENTMLQSPMSSPSSSSSISNQLVAVN